MSGRSFKLMRDFEAHSAEVRCLTIGRKSGLVFATGSEDRKVNLWSLTKQQSIMSLTGHSSAVECLSFDSGEQVIAAGSTGGTIKIWDLESQRAVRSLTGHKSNVSSLDFHPFGEYIASASFDTTVKLWDIKNRNCINTYRGHNEPITFVHFTPDGRWLVSGSEGGQVIVWDLSTAKQLHSFEQHTAAVRWLDFHPHEFLLATGSDDRTVKFFDLETFEMIGSTESDITRVQTVCFSPDGRCLLAGYHDSLKAAQWEPAGIVDSITVNWGHLLDSYVVRDQYVACSSTGTHVSIFVLPVEKLRPYGGDSLGASDAMSTTLRRINDTHRPVSRAQQSLRATAADDSAQGSDEQPALEVHGAPILPQQSPAIWGPTRVRDVSGSTGSTASSGGVIHVHSQDAMSPRVVSPPSQPRQVQSASKATRAVARKESSPPPQTAGPLGGRDRPIDLDIHAIAHSIREGPTEDAVAHEIQDTHRDMVKLLTARLQSLRTVRALWEVNVKSAVEEMAKINDIAVAADVINVMMKKPDLFNLERAVLLLPSVDGLLQCQFEDMQILALQTLALFANSFGPLIKTTLENPVPSGEIDFSREEREERCKLMAAAFKKAHVRLGPLSRRGKRLADPAQGA
eukprot:m51a1_g8241 putative katanin p80 wd40 repeat-containing subunit b1 (627) ;mRNA; r:99711-102236